MSARHGASHVAAGNPIVRHFSKPAAPPIPSSRWEQCAGSRAPSLKGGLRFFESTTEKATTPIFLMVGSAFFRPTLN